ncbi:MAG: cation diffusion facilitator family transporter [Lysobacteraceae bacterium]
MAGNADSLRTIFYALGANIGIFVVKLFAAIATGSGAMMAEAVHSLADCGNQGLLLLGIKRSKRPPTPDYPLGYGKEIYFWSFLVALMLFSVGGAFSIYEGVHKLLHPEPISKPWLAIAVLVISTALEWFSMRACMQEVNKVLEGRTLWRWFRESRQSELIVIFGEQLAALLGLILALAAVVATMLTGNPDYDAFGTLGIGVLLVVVAVFVAIEVKALLIGQSVSPQKRKEICEFLQGRSEIDTVHNVITLQLGPDIMVAVQAGMDWTQTAGAMVAQVNVIEADMRSQFPDVKWLFFEPDDSA